MAFKPLISEVQKIHPGADFINFTLPGLGGKNKLLDKNLRLKVADYSQIIVKFIESFNLKNFDIAASSLGGFFASQMLAKNLIQPRKIVLMSPLLNPHKVLNHSLKLQRLLLTGAHRIGLPLKILLSINYAYIWAVEWHKKTTASSNRFVPAAQKDFETTSENESVYLFNELLKKGEENLQAFRAKILLLVGEQDIPDIIDECKRLGKEGFKVETIKGGTHGYVFLDPIQTAAKISPFLF